MIRIGMVGENPNDTEAIEALLRQGFSLPIEYFPLIFDVNGGDLDNGDHKKRFRREYQWQRDIEGGVDLIIFIRDLDDLESNREKYRGLQGYFREWNKVIDEKGIFLLNIYELEALIWADVEGFNEKYGANLPIDLGDPMLIWEPKEELQNRFRYIERDSRKIFAEALRIDIVAKNCRYFREFLEKFEQALA